MPGKRKGGGGKKKRPPVQAEKGSYGKGKSKK